MRTQKHNWEKCANSLKVVMRLKHSKVAKNICTNDIKVWRSTRQGWRVDDKQHQTHEAGGCKSARKDSEMNTEAHTSLMFTAEKVSRRADGV